MLQNFTPLQLKGWGKIQASLAIAQQWHDGDGMYYARRSELLHATISFSSSC